MRVPALSILSLGLFLGFSGAAMADAEITNKDSTARVVYVECKGSVKGNNTIQPGNILSINSSDLNAAESGCIAKMGSKGINIYDGDEYHIVNGAFQRQ